MFKWKIYGFTGVEMRFIFTFLVVAVAALALTWYVGYDYNMYEYRLIKSLIVKARDYFGKQDKHEVAVAGADPHENECNSWGTLNDLMDKLFERIFDTYRIVYEHPSHKLSENLDDDVNDISMVVENFHSRITMAIHSLPEFLFPVHVIFKSMQANMLDTKDKLVKLSHDLQRKIDADYSESREVMIFQFAKFLQKLGHAIENEQDAVLGCICIGCVQLDAISAAAMENVNYCIDVAEERFRSIYNSTKQGLNLNLEHTVNVLTDSYTSPMSMIDTFFQLPVHVSISCMFLH